MSQHEEIKFTCDNCHKRLKGSSNLNIVTVKSDSSFWHRLHVRIQDVSGFHNDSKTRDADLCKPCTILLLKDALKRVKAGERATKGTEEIEQMGW